MSEPEAPRVTKPKGSMDMDASIWSELPFEMVGHVLSFLLMPDVCRNRSVCKEWNELILSDKFTALHGQHARRRRGPSFIAMSVRDGDRKQGREVWSCLDLSARRWYTFDEGFYEVGPFVSRVKSMDGGLVCRLRLAKPKQPAHAQHHSIIVHNVKGLTNFILPEIARHLNSRKIPELLMVVGSTSFKIFLINDNRCGTEILDDSPLPREERLKIQYDPLIHVFDSATREWKSIVNTCRIIEHGGLGHIMSILMYQGFLYALFLGLSSDTYGNSVWRLLRYNFTVESWENLDVCTYNFMISSLVVSNDCLFLVLWCGEDGSDSEIPEEWFFEVREIRTRDMTQETVLKLSAAEVLASFDIKTGPLFITRPCIGHLIRRYELLGISVIGFESSLFFMSQASGKSKLFDLVTRSWDHGLPSNPLARMHDDDENSSVWIGKHMNLLLPWNTDW